MTDEIDMGEDFTVWDASLNDDYQAWSDCWLAWPTREIFAHPGYVRLFASHGDKALCLHGSFSDGSSVLYPFILRCLPEPSSSVLEGQWSDISTPYGYGGPFVWNVEDRDGVADAFWRKFDQWSRDNNVISEFVRFTLFRDEILPYPGELRVRSANVVRSLSMDEPEMWMDFEHKVRKNVKKAIRSQVSIERDLDGTRLDEFLEIYYSTMNRRKAESVYHWDREFFEAIHRDLPHQFAYFFALRRSRVCSAELVLLSQRTAYSFLGGTDDSEFNSRPNDLLKFEIIRWARTEGYVHFVLGGGHEPEDGIYRYKRSFAPEGAIPFITGERIIQEEAYRKLVEDRVRVATQEGQYFDENTTFFPAYRAPQS